MLIMVIVAGFVGQFAFSMDGADRGPRSDVAGFRFRMEAVSHVSSTADEDRAITIDVLDRAAKKARARVSLATSRVPEGVDPVPAQAPSQVSYPPPAQAPYQAPSVQWVYPPSYAVGAAPPVQWVYPRGRGGLFGGVFRMGGRGGGRAVCNSAGCSSY